MKKSCSNEIKTIKSHTDDILLTIKTNHASQLDSIKKHVASLETILKDPTEEFKVVNIKNQDVP